MCLTLSVAFATRVTKRCKIKFDPMEDGENHYLVTQDPSLCGLMFCFSKGNINSVETTDWFYKVSSNFITTMKSTGICPLYTLPKMTNSFTPSLSPYMNELIELYSRAFLFIRLPPLKVNPYGQNIVYRQ